MYKFKIINLALFLWNSTPCPTLMMSLAVRTNHSSDPHDASFSLAGS